MKRSLLFAAIAVLGLLDLPVQAQNYRFEVPSLQMQVFVRADASALIVYDITLRNAPGARTIDVVDIGTPHAGYNLNNVQATISNRSLSDIRKSEYVSPGFEVHLGSQAIPGGREGTLHVEFTMPDMVYQDTTDAQKASLRVTPTWFGNEFVTGSGRIAVAVHFPPGVEPDEAVYHSRPFTAKAVFGADKHTVVTWDWLNERATGPHLVGVSFPKRVMSRVIHISKFGLLVKWFEETPNARITAAAVFFFGMGFLFFRFTGCTGISVFVVLGVLLGIWFFNKPAVQLIAFPPLIALIAWNEWHRRHRTHEYLPAIAEVEGGGIKRGLTAPEAAALLELPLSKVLGLAVFGLLKKGIIRMVQADPLQVEVDERFCIPDKSAENTESRAQFYQRVAAAAGTVIHNYEHPILFLLETNAGKPVAKIDFTVPLKKLIEQVAKRMTGFDLSDTQEYYRRIVRRAIAEAKAVGDIEQRQRILDRNFDWILLDDGYPTVFRSSGYDYQPSWMSNTRGGAAAAPVAMPHAPGGTTSLGDVASSFAGWSENTMGKLASSISPGSLNLTGASGGVIDLSGADRVAGDIFSALASSSGGSGGSSGGGCACACAGCACACACAGGGR